LTAQFIRECAAGDGTVGIGTLRSRGVDFWIKNDPCRCGLAELKQRLTELEKRLLEQPRIAL
jgi:hypothetical protein